jgi:hypothetical protein
MDLIFWVAVVGDSLTALRGWLFFFFDVDYVRDLSFCLGHQHRCFGCTCTFGVRNQRVKGPLYIPS